MEKVRILLVEDTDSVREVITRQLESFGISVTALGDGNGVKRELDRVRYDLVIADLHLPDCSGVDIARFAKAQNCKIILLSGDSNIETRSDLLPAQFDQILAKPITIDRWKKILTAYGFIDALPLTHSMPYAQMEYDETGVINLLSLQDQMGELDDVALQMLGRFPAMMRPLLDNISLSYHHHHAAQIAETAHSLKGAARSAGANHLGLLCEQIQTAAHNNQINPSQFTDLETEFMRVEIAIKKLCGL